MTPHHHTTWRHSVRRTVLPRCVLCDRHPSGKICCELFIWRNIFTVICVAAVVAHRLDLLCGSLVSMTCWPLHSREPHYDCWMTLRPLITVVSRESVYGNGETIRCLALSISNPMLLHLHRRVFIAPPPSRNYTAFVYVEFLQLG